MGFSQEGQGASREEWHGLCTSAGLEGGLVAPARVWVIEPGGLEWLEHVTGQGMGEVCSRTWGRGASGRGHMRALWAASPMLYGHSQGPDVITAGLSSS